MKDRHIALAIGNLNHTVVSDDNLTVYFVITDNTKNDTQPAVNVVRLIKNVAQ
jgi:hypothetical protein